MRPGRFFKLAVFFGFLLGILLLAQSVETWIFVSRSLIRQEGEREAIRKVDALDRLLRGVAADDTEKIGAAASELRQEANGHIAWVRVFTPEGKVLATDGDAPAGLPRNDRQWGGMRRDDPPQVTASAKGEVLVLVRPIRLRGGSPPVPPPLSGPGEPAVPPQRSGRPPMVLAEIALYLHGMAAPFGHLQISTAISLTSAIALLIAMLVIVFRFRHYVEGRQLAQQLDIARTVQLGLLPQPGARHGGVEFAGECIPALEVGGDFYDVFGAAHGPSTLVLGDVAGKGLPAALLSTLIQGAIRAAASVEHFGEAIAHLNELLCFRTAQERFATLFWCRYDPAAGVLRYVNAGHLPPLLLRRRVTGEVDVRRLEEGGPVLGVIPAARYDEGLETVSDSDLLVLYSDGITESANREDEEFGEERLIEFIRGAWNNTPAEICANLLAEIERFRGGTRPHDDQTIVVARLAASEAIRNRPAGAVAGASA